MFEGNRVPTEGGLYWATMVDYPDDDPTIVELMEPKLGRFEVWTIGCEAPWEREEFNWGPRVEFHAQTKGS